MLLTKGRFFARILTVELACPDCGYLHSTRAKGAWDASISKFQCNQCKRVWVLGVIAWRVKRGLTVAIDSVPTREEAEVLREERFLTSQGLLASKSLGKGYANFVERERECRCLFDSVESKVDCPLHGWQGGE